MWVTKFSAILFKSLSLLSLDVVFFLFVCLLIIYKGKQLKLEMVVGWVTAWYKQSTAYYNTY